MVTCFAHLIHQSAKLLAWFTGENCQLQSSVLQYCKQTWHVSSNIWQKLVPLGRACKRSQRNKIWCNMPTLNQQWTNCSAAPVSEDHNANKSALWNTTLSTSKQLKCTKCSDKNNYVHLDRYYLLWFIYLTYNKHICYIYLYLPFTLCQRKGLTLHMGTVNLSKLDVKDIKTTFITKAYDSVVYLFDSLVGNSIIIGSKAKSKKGVPHTGSAGGLQDKVLL